MNEGGPGRATLDNTAAANDSRSDDLARSLTRYAMHASPRRVEQMLRQAYGDRVPGSAGRWLSQQPEREQWAASRLQRKAWRLYRRVHGRPSPGELARLAFEDEVRARNVAVAALAARGEARAVAVAVAANAGAELVTGARPTTRRCDHCGAEYPRRRRGRRFCSAACYRDWRSEPAPSPAPSPEEIKAEMVAALDRLAEAVQGR